MRKNQQSIDGFTPRRRNNSLEVSKHVSSVVKKEVKKAEKPRRVIEEKIHNSPEDIEAALQNLEIEEVKEIARKERAASKKERKLLRKLEKKNSKREKKGKKPLSMEQFKRRRIVRRVFLVGFIAILAFAAPKIINAINNLQKAFKGNIIGALFSEEKKLATDGSGRTNILIFGTSPKGWDGEELTDSIMIASVNQETKKIYTVSLPRDLWVKHTCKSWLGTYGGKLNETYGCGYHDSLNSGSSEEEAEKAGQKALATTAKEVLGLDIQYVVHGNWQVLVDIVNSVGGIDVLVEAYDGSSRVYDVATGINYKSGETVHMDGEKALAFSRARGSEGGVGLSGSNFDRERNQQKILKATLEKVNQQKLNPLALLDIVSAVGNNVQTSFKDDEIKSAVNLVQGFSGSGMTSLPLISETDASGNYLTTGIVSGISVVIPSAGTYDYSEIQAYISKNTLGGEIVKEAAKIIILNGTNYSGLASQEQKNLKKEGYTVSKIDSAPTSDYETTKVYYVEKDSKPDTVKKLAEKYSTSAEKIPSSLSLLSKDVDIVIVLGENSGN